jgi:hypothetical protein
MMKSIDDMKNQQDAAQNPPSLEIIKLHALRTKEANAEMGAVSTPYDLPNGADPMPKTLEWVDALDAQGLLVWHRHSWASDEGWYGVAKNTTNDRIQDTKNWILTNGKAFPRLFKKGYIFTPKPEPQNMGINGVNGNSPYRFASAAVFNVWIRDITLACKQAFEELGFEVAIGKYDPTKINIGYWGFDGFVACGYGNPDWQGKSFLEKATVDAMGGAICVDHYPAASGKPMSDFFKVLKQAHPTMKYIQLGEYGATGSGDAVVQIQQVFNDILAEPMVDFVNYWHLGAQFGTIEKLLNADHTFNAAGLKIKEIYGTIPPVPAPPSDTTPVLEALKNVKIDLGVIMDDLRKTADEVQVAMDDIDAIIAEIELTPPPESCAPYQDKLSEIKKIIEQ